jgi:2-haloacid dehalogenase
MRPKLEEAGPNRRRFLCMAATVAATAVVDAQSTAARGVQPAIRAVTFDAFAIFDARPVFQLVEHTFPGRGAAFSDQWRVRQFEYTWLRNSMRAYTDFWHVTEDALNYAAKQNGIDLSVKERATLMGTYMDLKPWPDGAAVLQVLRERGLRLALLSNMTRTMMEGCVKASGLEAAFEFQLSTDQVRAFKPDPTAYRMGLDAFHLEKKEVAFVAYGGWDAAGAKSFGYPTYWVNRTGVPAEELGVHADASYPDLSSLTSFIDAH